jgi:TPR repeat protein
MYAKGQGTRGNQVAAARWYRKAADQGHAKAQFNLALMYENGEGVPRDYGAAARWFRKAADQGDVDAQLNLGVMYSNGQGVPQDPAVAEGWYQKAANHGGASAKGEGASLGDVRALTWLDLAAVGGDKAAARNGDVPLHASAKRKSRR